MIRKSGENPEHPPVAVYVGAWYPWSDPVTEQSLGRLDIGRSGFAPPKT